MFETSILAKNLIKSYFEEVGYDDTPILDKFNKLIGKYLKGASCDACLTNLYGYLSEMWDKGLDKKLIREFIEELTKYIDESTASKINKGLKFTESLEESNGSLKESKNKYKFYDEYSDVFTAISKDNGKTFTIIDDDTFTDVADKDYGLKPNQIIDIDYVNEVSLAYELLEKKNLKESKNITLSDLCDTLGISYMDISSIGYDDNEGTSYNCDEMLRVGIKIINNVAIQITGFGNFIGAFNFNKYELYSEPSCFVLEDNKLRHLEIYLK